MLLDPLDDLDGFLTTAEQYADLGIDLINFIPPVDNTDPLGFVNRLGDSVIPRVAQFGVRRGSSR